MNNKFIAGIAAMAISASLMSTVAFAADPTFAVDGDTATLSFKVGENNADVTVSEEAQITMMAYLVDGTVATPKDIPAYSNQTVVALDQVDGANGFGDVLIAASKLVAGKKIAVVLGGSDGTTDKYLVAQEVIDNKVVVTVMNGAAAIEIEAVDGKVTLPATAELGKASDYYTFTLYSWVTADGTTEYLAGAEVDTAALEGVTLYAKFASDKAKGDINRDGALDLNDYSPVKNYVASAGKANAQKLNVAIFAGATVLYGDINGDGVIDLNDYSPIKNYVASAGKANAQKLDQPIYIVNK